MDTDTSLLLSDVVGTYQRLTQDEATNVRIVLGAYRSLRGKRRDFLAYVSMPITSGLRLYRVFEEHGVRSIAELTAKLGKDALWELVIKPNIAEGIALADELGARGDRLYIAPSVFEAKKWRWTQDAYMALWYFVQAEAAGQHYLMDGWEFSTGGVKEVVFTFLMRYGFISRFGREFREEHGIDFLSDLPLERQAAEFEAMQRVRLFRKSEGEWLEAHPDTALWKAVRGLLYLRERELPYEDLIAPVRRLAEIPRMARERGMRQPTGGWDSPIYHHAVEVLRSFAA